MSVPKLQLLTEDEYLEIERAAEYRSEFLRGEMFAMAGGSPPHSLVACNVVADLNTRLKRRPCRVYNSDLQVKVVATGLYTYPDVSVVCGENQYDGSRRDVIINPIVLIEVLSDSTESYDRGDKFAHYQQIESLQEYVMVAQDRPRVECYRRQGEGEEWRYARVAGLDKTLHLDSIDCDLPLAEIYDKVELLPPLD